MAADDPPGTADKETFSAALQRACDTIGLAIGPRQRARMYAHFQRVIEANRSINLTRITSPADAAVKHYADSVSLLAAPWVDAAALLSVLDVGTGAGFPALPLAILCPAWTITAIDGTGKKARFVAQAAADIGLANVVARHARAADLTRDHPAAFDLIVMRAVAKIADGLREVRPLMRPGGAVVFYKTDRIDPAELRRGDRAARSLGLSTAEPFAVTLRAPEGELHRRLIRYTG